MRTTVALDPDVEAKLRSVARERGQSFNTTLNEAVRTGLTLGAVSTKRDSAPARPIGVRRGIELDRALRLAGELDDSETVRKLKLRQ